MGVGAREVGVSVGHTLKIRCRQFCLRPRGNLASEKDRKFREARSIVGKVSCKIAGEGLD